MRAKSATFAKSVMALMSLGHSTNVTRCDFDERTVIGPTGFLIFYPV